MNHIHFGATPLRSFCVAAWLGLTSASTASEETPPFTEEAWDEPPTEVNEGVLEFLTIAPPKPVHHHQNLIRIKPSSLQDGWVEMQQCHSHLDPVPRLEIVYHPQRIRNIRVVSYRNIGTARVEGPSLQLSDIGPAAEICLTADSRALHILDNGALQLRNGPYMRRFLDGYYPMRLSLEVHYPPSRLRFNGQRPLPEASTLNSPPEGVFKWSGWFTGRLSTEIDFVTTDRSEKQ